MTSPRWIAARAGEKRFTGNPCKHCGAAIRFTSSGACVVCANNRAKARNDQIRKLLRGA